MARTAPAPKKPPKPKTKGKKPRNRRGSSPVQQASFLAKVKSEFPLITSEEFVEKFHVSTEEVHRMRHFITEYIRDFDPKAAALRMGYPEETARDTARLLLHHSYTQIRMIEVFEKMEAEKMISGQAIIARLWKEANLPDGFFNNAPSRIAALKTLARIIGLDVPKPKDDGNKIPTGGIMIVPIAMNPDQWAEHARQSQRALRDSTAIDV